MYTNTLITHPIMTESMKAALRRSNELKQVVSEGSRSTVKGRNSEKLNEALLFWGIHISSASDVQDKL